MRDDKVHDTTSAVLESQIATVAGMVKNVSTLQAVQLEAAEEAKSEIQKTMKAEAAASRDKVHDGTSAILEVRVVYQQQC